MRRVTLIFRNGPMEGTRRQISLGRITIGRNPGPEGLLVTGDASVSRSHGELFEDRGRVVYRNLSSHGSRVDAKPVDGVLPLAPGAVLELGGTRLEVRFEGSESERAAAGPASLWKSGLLARPAVRIGLAVYLSTLVALVVLATGGGDTLETEWARTREAYLEGYAAHLSEDVRTERLATAKRQLDHLRALERSERWEEARATCRRMMAIDGDPASPIFRFAARRLGILAKER